MPQIRNETRTATRRTSRVRPSTAKRPTAKSSTAAKPADRFDAQRGGPRPVSTSVSRDGTLSFAGFVGAKALIEAARSMERSGSIARELSAPQKEKLFSKLQATLASPASTGKRSSTEVLTRSAAATVLLDLAGAADQKLREKALSAYVNAMVKEPHAPLRASMMINLEASRLSLGGDLSAKASEVRRQLLPTRPPYESWLSGRGEQKLEVRHYVMDEFWKAEVAAYKKRGLTVVDQRPGFATLQGKLEDPRGKFPPLTVRVVMEATHENVLRDMDDPKVHMVIYSGHSQLGGVVSLSLVDAPKQMKGEKLLQIYNCRGKQTAGELHERFPGVHLSVTESSAYGPDDREVLDRTFEMLARRGEYSDLYRSLSSGDMIQPKSNYILPHDPRMLLTRDTDDDGLRDLGPLGADRFYDPVSALEKGGRSDFKPRVSSIPIEELSGEKLDHAVSYANTAFFYFAEDNRAAPLAVSEADKLVTAGWFKAPADERVRIVPTKKNGRTFYEVSVNSQYAGQTRQALTAMVLYELQRFHCMDDHGAFTEADKLRGLMLVGSYVDVMVGFADECDAVLQGFGAAYGFSGVDYDVMFRAGQKDGHSTATEAALDFLRRNKVTAPA